MTGNRATIERSGDTHLDVYATIGQDRVRLMVGTKLQSGTWYVTLNGLTSVGKPATGSLSISTWGFDGSNPLSVQAAPSFRNTVAHSYSAGSLTFPIYQTDTTTGWAFEFDL
jgi:hypothetical protein